MRAAPATAASLSPCEVAYRLGSRRVVPTAMEIVEQTGCSRAAAYRWRTFALQGGCAHTKRERRLPRATAEVLVRCSGQRPRVTRLKAAERLAAVLALTSAPESQLSRMLALSPTTTQAAIRTLRVRRVISPNGHVEHRPLSRVRGGAIRWAATGDASSALDADGASINYRVACERLPATRAPQWPGTFGSLDGDSLRLSPHTPCTAARHTTPKRLAVSRINTPFPRNTVQITKTAGTDLQVRDRRRVTCNT